MSKSIHLISLLMLTAALTACGGGSSNSSGSNSGGSNSGSATPSVITTQCAQTADQVTVTTAGCVTSGSSPQTVICVTAAPTQTIKILSGTNKTVAQVNSSSSFTGNNITFNNLKYVCG